jgi:pimeloyl-ACP methyl ester carboxylesterase
MKFSVLPALLLISCLATAQENRLRPLDKDLSDYQYPFPVHYLSVTVQLQSFRMAYMDVRPQHSNGATVLLLHGKNFNGAYWEQTARALSDKGYRVLIPDQLGFGKSSKPAQLQYSFQLLAQNTRSLLDSLQIDKVVVAGHSMGGMLAIRFSLMYPERTHKLILVNPIGLEDWKLKVPYTDISKLYSKELKQNYDSIKKYQMANYYHHTWKPEYDKWLNLLAGWTLHSDYPIIAWNAALTSDMVFTQPVVYEFKHIRTPTLLIMGQEDRTAVGKDAVPEAIKKTMGNYPLLGRQTKQLIRNATLVELGGVGHLPHIEAFDKFIQPLLGFLKD